MMIWSVTDRGPRRGAPTVAATTSTGCGGCSRPCQATRPPGRSQLPVPAVARGCPVPRPSRRRRGARLASGRMVPTRKTTMRWPRPRSHRRCRRGRARSAGWTASRGPASGPHRPYRWGTFAGVSSARAYCKAARLADNSLLSNVGGRRDTHMHSTWNS